MDTTVTFHNTKAEAIEAAQQRRANGESVKVYRRVFINPRTGQVDQTFSVS